MLRAWGVILLLVGYAGTLFAQQQVEDTRFSLDRGFYSTPTNLVISSQTPGATITYTLDGSDPRTSPTATSDTNPVLVLIDPDSTAGKWKATPAVMVRAYAHSAGMLPTNVDTHTYIFPLKVKSQSDIRPTGDEVFWETTEMDPEVVTDPAYADEMEEALLSIPSLSIVMEHEGLFGTEGIHRGDNLDKDWEMPCSMELIYPDTPHFAPFKGFQIDCGIKNQGGGGLWNNGTYDHKQSFGIRFRHQYGAGKLDYPFFEHAPLNADSEAGTYDKLVLRAGHNKSYGIDYDAEHTVYTRDQLARDLQIDMTGIGGHGSFVHLYLNGIYWGLYNPSERQDNAFTASYLGGNEDDYFCGKGKGGATSGIDDRYNEWLNTVSTSADINTLLEYCNIDNHADMALINSYAAVGDFPQYYYGVGNNPGGQVHFFNWDSEDAFGGGSKRSSDNPSTDLFARIAGFYNMWDNNVEYRMNFADRAYKACFNDGTLTDGHVLKRWNVLCDSIYTAILCESARWGDERVTIPRTRDQEWASARAAVAAGTIGKADRLIAELIQNNFYPDINPPLLKTGNTVIDVTRKEVPSGFDLTIDRDGSSGTIYYTTDGSDPRAVGGAARGINAGTGTTITLHATTCIKARTLHNGIWSALHETLLFIEQDWSDLKITEIMYNPQDALMTEGAVISAITGDAGSIDPNYANRARLIFSNTLPEVLTRGDKVIISGAINPANNGIFTIAKMIHSGSIGQTRTKEVLLSEALADESSGSITGDFLYDGDRYEFVEIKNTGATPLPLGGITFTRGIKYTFPNGATLAPGGFAVLARNPWDFAERYPAITPFGSFPASSLDNNSERLELAWGTSIRHDVLSTGTTSEGNGVVILQAIPSNIGAGDRMQISLSGHYGNNKIFEIQSVQGNTVYIEGSLPTDFQGAEARFFDIITAIEYGDSDPWPLPADGYGFSLVPTNSNPTGNQNLAEKWRASANTNGSPGQDDLAPETPGIKVNEVLTHTDEPQLDTIELYNPDQQATDIGGWYLTDNPDLPKKWTIPAGTIIPANGYKTFYEGHYSSSVLEFDSDEFGSAFSLSSTGDEIYLFSPTLGYSHGFGFEGSYNGISFGRHETSEGEEHFPSQLSFTPSASNAGPAIGPVIISEIMYNPADGHHEFIELLNTSDSPVLLYDPTTPTNTWKVGGIGFQFPDTHVALDQGQIMLLVRDSITPAAFRATYNISNEIQIFSYTGKLANDGETLTLRAPDEPVQTGANAGEVAYIIIDQVAYANAFPWPTEADGLGRSLERISSEAYGNDVSNWGINPQNGGSPGLMPQLSEGPLVIDNDSDGLDDRWEITYFSSTNHASGNPDNDFDLDGLSNLDEFISGSDPTDETSYLKFTSVKSSTNGYIVEWNSVTSRIYRIHYTETLDQPMLPIGSWMPYPQDAYTDSVHAAQSSGYYDIRVQLEE